MLSTFPAVGREIARDSRGIWRIAESQHGVVTRRQLLTAGLTSDEIDGRIARARLFRLWRGVYAVGRPSLTPRGWWSAAVLACGDGAVLSHLSAGSLWGMWSPNTGNEGEIERPWRIHVTVPAARSHRLQAIRVHRRSGLDAADFSLRDGIRVTSPRLTLIDLATILQPGQLEAAVGAADRLELMNPERLRSGLDRYRNMAGIPALRRVLDRDTFRLTDCELERRFLRLVRRAGMSPPQTQQRVNGYRVDFYWPEFRLIVETDGLRYHRTAAQQSRDRARDQAHAAAGFIALRFTHAQVRYDPSHVMSILRAVLKGG
jgi:very-short-patch-repair endonuclease